MTFLRSTVFNLVFYGGTALVCLLAIWLPPLLPRRIVLGFVVLYMRVLAVLEAAILGLRYEVRGREHLPADGPFIVAAKHQSAWETLKLHLLFHDPAVVLKQELMQIPIWNWFPRKLGMIPIDRATGTRALRTMLAAARTAAAAGRPIVVFPQGTRTAPGQSAPYRAGIGVLYHQMSLPVVPLALNSGMFWPRRSWCKRSGTVVLEFLPPIQPGLPRPVFMTQLEEHLETASDRLVIAAGGPATHPATGRTKSTRREPGATRSPA